MRGVRVCLEMKLTAWRNPDVSHVEGLIPREFGADAVEVLGARALLADLENAKAPWAIVVQTTSQRALYTLVQHTSDKAMCLDFGDSPIGNRMARCYAACTPKEHGSCRRRQTREAR